LSRTDVRHFDFWGKLSLAWHAPLRSIAPDFSIKYSYFEVDTPASTRAGTALELYSHPPSQSLLQGLKPVAESCAANDRVFRLEHRHGRMRFTSWIVDLPSDRVQIYYEFPWRRRLQWPWPLIPDHLVGMHLVQPMIEFLLSRQNICFLHAGAAARDGKALLLPGRGSTLKTTALMHLMREGWDFLADDLVALQPATDSDPARLLTYPTAIGFFDYFYRYAADEKVSVPRMIGALRHLSKRQPPGFPIAPPSSIQTVNLLIRWSNAQTVADAPRPVGQAEIDQILSINKLERLTFVDIDEAFGRFMLQHDQVYGLGLWDSFWQGQHDALTRSLLTLLCQTVRVGKNLPIDKLLLPQTEQA